MASPPIKSPSIIVQLAQLVKQIDEECALKLDPCCTYGCTQCCGGAPVTPVPPLIILHVPPQITQPQKDIDDVTRHDNFYNNYNIDWRKQGGAESQALSCLNNSAKANGVTVDGKSPCCDTLPNNQLIEKQGKMQPLPHFCNDCSKPWCLKLEL